jgi:Tfp pilus assembly protein PilO
MKYLFGPQGPPGWLVTGGLALVALGYVFFVFFPAQNAMKSMRQLLVEKQQYITQTDELFATTTATRLQLEQTGSLVKQWHQNSPDPQQADRLPSQISNTANLTDVRILKLEPQPLKHHGLIVEYPILVNAEGGFDDIFNFCNGVENLPQTIWVQDVKLERAGELGGNLRCEMTLTIFGDLAD